MTFRRFGRSHHLRIRTVDDLRAAVELDRAHWVATSAPAGAFNCDPAFLAALDADGDGRILHHELAGAIQWTLGMLRDPSGLVERSTSLRLDVVNADEGQGRRIIDSARRILHRLGRADGESVSLADVRHIRAEVEARPVSEAGVVLPEAFEDAEVGRFADGVISTVGGADHPGGTPGVSAAKLDEFLSLAAGHLEWRATGEIPPGQQSTDVMPLGADTPSAAAAYRAVRDKVDQYFAQCVAVSYDPRTAGRIRPGDAELGELDFDDPGAIDAFLADSPLASPRGDGVLDFEGEINPHYAASLDALRRKVVEPLLGDSVPVLSREQWKRVEALLTPHEAWSAGKVGAAVERLGADTLRRYVEGPFAGRVRERIARSAETAFVLDNIRLTEKLILCQANLIDFANNFVSFPHVYETGRRAMFELGTLVMDGRHYNLAVRVDSRAEHVAVASNGTMFLLYVEVVPPGGAGRYEAVVPVTSGGKGNLFVGKRGVFRDVAGRELDARVVQIVENPISVAEALWSPFRRIGRLLSGKIEALGSAAERKFEERATTAVQRVESAAETPQAPEPAPPSGTSRGLMAGGLLMGGGVALAALGSAIAYIAKTVSTVHWWQIVAVIGGVILAVMLPVSVVAILKLRRRDLSAILEGAGWAINARMRLTWSQSRYFTRRPRYPKGARGVRRHGWRWLIAAVVLAGAIYAVAWYATRSPSSPAEDATTADTQPSAAGDS